MNIVSEIQMLLDDDGWLWRWLKKGREWSRSIADAPTGIGNNFWIAEPAGYARKKLLSSDNVGVPSGANSVSSDANGVPSGANSVSSDANGVPSGANSVSSDANGVPSGANSVSSDANGVPSGTNWVSSDAIGVPSGTNWVTFDANGMPSITNLFEVLFYNNNFRFLSVCLRKYFIGNQKLLIFKRTVNPKGNRGIFGYLSFSGACSKQFLAKVLSSAVDNTLLIVYNDINGKACFTIVSAMNAMDFLWNFGFGGGKRKIKDANNEDCNDSYIAPRFTTIPDSNLRILLQSEGKHQTIEDLYLTGDHVNTLLIGAAAFVSRMGIRKVAVLPAFFAEMLANNPNADPLRYIQIFKCNFDILLAPVCEQTHWYLIVFYVALRKIVSYNSLHTGRPQIFNALKQCIQSVTHVQFEDANEDHTVTSQKNGYNCGVHAYKKGEQICFTGESTLFEVFHEEAERARAREILIKIKNNEITDEWVRPVQNATDFVNLNAPIDEDEATTVQNINDSDDDEIKVEYEKLANTDTKSKCTVDDKIESSKLDDSLLSFDDEDEGIIVVAQPQNINANVINENYEPISYGYLLNDLKIVMPTEEHESVEDLYLSGDQVMGVISAVAEFVVKNNIRKVAVLPPNYAAILTQYPETDPFEFLHVLKADFDFLLAPVCQNDHWYLVVFKLRTRKVTVYNSKLTGFPQVYEILKANIERFLNITFEYEDKNDTVTLQRNGYDCGILCVRSAEEICFNGENKRMIVLYSIAERARVRHIVQRLAFYGCPNEWFPFVKNENDYFDSVEHLKVGDANGKFVGILDKAGGKTEIEIDTTTIFDKSNIKENNITLANKTLEENVINDSIVNKVKIEMVDGDSTNTNLNIELNEEIVKVGNQKLTYKEYLKKKKVKQSPKAYAAWKREQQSIEERVAELEKKKSDKRNMLLINPEIKKQRTDFNTFQKLASIENESNYINYNRLKDASESIKGKRKNATKEEKDKTNALFNDKRKGKGKLLFAAEDATDVEPHVLQLMNVKCKGCEALHFPEEKGHENGFYTSCCQKGTVSQLLVDDYPEELKQLWKKEHADKKLTTNFHDNITSLNSSLSFAHPVAKQCGSQSGVRGGPYFVKIMGELWHRMCRWADPMPKGTPYAGQLYIVDMEEANRIRCGAPSNKKVEPRLLSKLEKIIREQNIFAKSFTMLNDTYKEEKAIAESEGREPEKLVLAFDKNVNDKLSRNYDAPTANEVAAVYRLNPDETMPRKQIVIRYRDTNKKEWIDERVSNLSPFLEPLTYVLFDITGKGKYWDITKKRNDDPKSRKLSLREAVMYRLAVREESPKSPFNPLHYSGKMMAHWLVDMGTRYEANNLEYIKNNQKTLHVAKYTAVTDYLKRKSEKANLLPGKTIILPSTFYGSPRCMSEKSYDLMSMAQQLGKPTGFGTLTCSTFYEEIKANMYPGQSAWQRIDIVNRIFKLKVDYLIQLIKDYEIFGKVVYIYYVVEFQKRGLAHIHWVMRLENMWDTPEKVDQIICAELPIEPGYIIKDPLLLEFVLKYMIHSPCGEHNPNAPCMKDGKCIRGYPKPNCDNTIMDEKGFTIYRRRNNGITAKIKYQGKEYEIDNRWVVPYNAYLLKKMRCHINLECVFSILTVFYLFKYMFKGNDKALMEWHTVGGEKCMDINEPKAYVDGRYMSAHEAHWRLSEFPLFYSTHKVERLGFHTEGGHTVALDEDVSSDVLIQETTDNATSKLLACFDVNNEKETGLLYEEMPQHYVWDTKTVQSKDENGKIVNKNVRYWKPRVKFVKPVVSRIYSISPKHTESFYLRSLLTVVRSPKSFEDLKTFKGVTYKSFREAADARGMIVDDKLYVKAMEEAKDISSPKGLRRLLARIFAHCDVKDPLALFEQFWESMVGDLKHRYKKDELKDIALMGIVRSMIYQDKELSDYPALEAKMQELNFVLDTSVDDVLELLEKGEQMYSTLNEKQLKFVDHVQKLVKDKNGGCVFLYGCGGAGKTYSIKTVINLLKAESFEVIVMAWSGIAASLYPKGRTCHNVFRLDFPFKSDSNSTLNVETKDAQKIREAAVIFWDEAPMAPKQAMKVIDLKLRDLMQVDAPFGGKVLVLSGDFRQIPAIVENGGPMDVVNASICNSPLWPLFQKFELTENKRANADEKEFAATLLKIGNGETIDEEGCVDIPSHCIVEGNLVGEIFEELIAEKRYTELTSRAILAARHDDVRAFNEQVLQMLPPEGEMTYAAQDAVKHGEGELHWHGVPQYFKDTHINGFPSHSLTLRINSVIMLLRNLSIEEGLCNGTRLLVTDLRPNVIAARKLLDDGTLSAEKIMLPRITLKHDAGPFELYRHQFPVMLAHALTVNKSQGQSFEKVGVFLEKEVWSHGMLYVALSRTKAWDCLKIQLKKGRVNKTKNVVYAELIAQIG